MTWLKTRLNISDREKATFPIAILLLVVATVLRVQPHTPNVTPFFAVSVLVGFILGRERAVLAGLLSAAAMVVSDLALGLHESMLFVYAGMAMAALVGAYGSSFVVGRGQGLVAWLKRIAGAFLVSGVASVVFFVVSNIGVWLVGGLYAHTFQGLVECFVMAVPFFSKSLAADLSFGTLFLVVAERLMSGAFATKSVAAEAESVKVIHGR